MNPINPVFSNDYNKFVLQREPIIIDPYTLNPPKKFTTEKSKDAKKAKKKEPSPWIPKKPKKNEDSLDV